MIELEKSQIELDKGLMANLEQVMNKLDRLRKHMADESSREKIANIKDVIEFYKKNQMKIKVCG